MNDKDLDIHFMRHALSLARRGLGRTWPNPSVGCVIVKNRVVIGRGRTATGGRPHAEAMALREAGAQARGATAYVTLEPCVLAGREGPCAQGLIEAGVARVVVACIDPNPLVCGQGIEALKAAGIEVTLGVMEDEAKAMNKGFFLKFSEDRPLVSLKAACSLDGKIALGNGRSQWITGEAARRHVHDLRAQHDAVLVGIGTVKADDPMLNARVDGLMHKTVRVVLDGRLEIPADSRLVKSAREFPVWIFHTEGTEDHKKALEEAGVKLFFIENKAVKPILKILAAQGITRLLVEGGRYIHKAFLQEGYGDALYIYRAPCVLGGDALGAFLEMGFQDLSEIKDFARIETRALGQDLLEIYARAG